MKLLVLHGWGQSAEEMAQVAGRPSGRGEKLKKGSLAKSLQDELGCELVFAGAPHRLPRASTVMIDGISATLDDSPLTNKEERAWFYYSASDPRDCLLDGSPDAPGFLAEVDRNYTGWQQSVETLERIWEESGPFDGVLGFSQGAVMAHILCWLGEVGCEESTVQDSNCFRVWRNLKLAIFCSGFPSRLPHMRLDQCRVLKLPSLHISGTHDKNVPPEHQRALCACFAGAELYTHDHPRGHVLPQKAADRAKLVAFIRRVERDGFA